MGSPPVTSFVWRQRRRMDRADRSLCRALVGPERYTTHEEHEALARRQQPLGLPAATRAALIPISKSQAWWRLSDEEQRDPRGNLASHRDRDGVPSRDRPSPTSATRPGRAL